MDASAEYIAEWPPPIPPGEEGAVSGTSREDGIEEEEEEKERRAVKKCRLSSSDHQELVYSHPSVKASVLLAQWWKAKSREKDLPLTTGTSSTDPHTLLYHISRLDASKEFLQRRIDYLSSIPKKSPEVNISLATCYHMLGADLQCTETAIRLLQEAKDVAVGGLNKETEWLLQLLGRQKWVAEIKEEGMRKIQNWSPEKLQMPECIEVERRAFSDLSCQEFHELYAMTHTPVIVTGLVEQMTVRPWTLEYIKEVIGHKRAPLKRVVSGSTEWAQLESAGECEVGKFIDSLDQRNKGSKDLLYLFDWSLPLHSPELMCSLKIPEYFADDILSKTPEGSLYRDSWPSLFIAPAHITSGLHVDAFGSNFWMALFEGRKRWVFFPPQDLPYLYPVYHNSTDAVFEVDLSDKALATIHHPLLSLTSPRECTLQPRELLFVPSGSPHRVENLEKSLAISANFVDSSNIETVKRELKVNGVLDPRAKDLMAVLPEN